MPFDVSTLSSHSAGWAGANRYLRHRFAKQVISSVEIHVAFEGHCYMRCPLSDETLYFGSIGFWSESSTLDGVDNGGRNEGVGGADYGSLLMGPRKLVFSGIGSVARRVLRR